MQETRKRQLEKGFTLLETMIALVIMFIGVLGLAAMLGDSLAYMQGSQADFIAQQKAEEAVEAINTAKYTNNITFAQVSNFGVGNPGGLFLSGPLPILQPGPDGLVGATTDTGAPPAYILLPGPDNILGTADDVQVPLSNFTRTITITPMPNEGNALSKIVVTVNYTVGKFTRQYSITTYISAYD